ncbi:hypothetical protein QBC36DRAFT_291089 [Triangularia setosa]|uniref:Uncharacterized protein n=1 Tax=Triangularia setosa TaxID=2587417 RepID=A0AAN7A6F3_9PEZI|nr:hypothetical protein QBC36DRAFT_291089 [Podospora setosa]
MAELANTSPVLSLAGVANSQGYCNLNLAEVVHGIIITATQPPSTSTSSSSTGGLLSGLPNGILGRRDLEENLKEKAAEQKENAQRLKDRLKADAVEEKEGMSRKTCEAKCGAALVVPTSATSVSPSPTNPLPRPAKTNSQPTRPESAEEITETAVAIEEVSEVTAVEECIQKREKASIWASVKTGEVRERLGVTVRKGVEVDNCLYFVGGVDVVNLEVVLLAKEEIEDASAG